MQLNLDVKYNNNVLYSLSYDKKPNIKHRITSDANDRLDCLETVASLCVGLIISADEFRVFRLNRFSVLTYTDSRYLIIFISFAHYRAPVDSRIRAYRVFQIYLTNALIFVLFSKINFIILRYNFIKKINF